MKDHMGRVETECDGRRVFWDALVFYSGLDLERFPVRTDIVSYKCDIMLSHLSPLIGALYSTFILFNHKAIHV